VILIDKNTYRLNLRDITLKDTGVIHFECGDLKSSGKINVIQCKSCSTVNHVYNYEYLGDKPPRIDATRFSRTMTVRAGRPITLEIPYDAYPVPMMTWSKDANIISSDMDNPCQTTIDARKCKLNM
jgi:hypothetical protein